MGIIVSRDKKLLFPPFVAILDLFESKLQAANLPFYIYMGLRDFETQDALYAQGRTAPGGIVTNAKGGYSWHNYGLAADYVLDIFPTKPSIQWSWDIKADVNKDGRNDWLQMAEIAVSCGLDAGYFWKKFPDAPHVENRFGLTINEAFELHRLGGIQKVWEHCEV